MIPCFLNSLMWRWNEYGELVEPDGTKHSIAASILNEQTADSRQQVGFSQPFPQSMTAHVTHVAQPVDAPTQDAQTERENPPNRQSRLKVFQNLCDNQDNTK